MMSSSKNTHLIESCRVCGGGAEGRPGGGAVIYGVQEGHHGGGGVST